MKKKLILLIFFLNATICYTQNSNSAFYVYDSRSSISSDEDSRLYYTLIIKSNNKDFNSDAYKFQILNQKNFDEFLDLNEIKNKIDIDSINYYNVEDLKKFEPCGLHEFISKKNKFYLIINEDEIFFTIKMNYIGTEKNLELLPSGF
ncbi:hypothetical protein [uncultured Mesonia sp.]|uniref:hypothetical protein n=1 Tax=uncultured Mesonia sp. TaxID=399731 RepID=UPI00374E7DD1